MLRITSLSVGVHETIRGRFIAQRIRICNKENNPGLCFIFGFKPDIGILPNIRAADLWSRRKPWQAPDIRQKSVNHWISG